MITCLLLFFFLWCQSGPFIIWRTSIGAEGRHCQDGKFQGSWEIFSLYEEGLKYEKGGAAGLYQRVFWPSLTEVKYCCKCKNLDTFNVELLSNTERNYALFFHVKINWKQIFPSDSTVCRSVLFLLRN